MIVDMVTDYCASTVTETTITQTTSGELPGTTVLPSISTQASPGESSGTTVASSELSQTQQFVRMSSIY